MPGGSIVNRKGAITEDEFIEQGSGKKGIHKLKILNARRFNRKLLTEVETKMMPNSTLMLTFEGKMLPTEVELYNNICEVKPSCVTDSDPTELSEEVMRMVILSAIFYIFVKKATCIIECPRGDFQSQVKQNHTCETYMYFGDYEVHCFGRHLRDVPSDLNKTLNKLVVTDSLLRYVKKDSYKPYRERLQDVTLSGLPCLRVIEDGTFADIPNLRTIYIYNAPQLKFLHGLLKNVTSTSFKSLRIINTGLHEVPDLFHLPFGNTMFLLDLDHNKIERLTSNSITVIAQQVTINFNDIKVIDNYAFNGSQIARLDIRANNKLSTLEEFAFAGLQNLRELDLSQTAIESLPIEGLKELETLKIQETPSLQTIPSIYDLGNLKVARLTHHFHCCAFKYPEQHSPAKHAAYEKKMKDFCKQTRLHGLGLVQGIKSKREISYTQYIPNTDNKMLNISFDHHLNKLISQVPGNQMHHFTIKPTLEPLRGQLISHQDAKESDEWEDDGVFHSSPTIINTTAVDAFCGNITFRRPDVECIPESNALNPCEDIMGFSWLRISVWFVVVLAVLGNMAVVVVILFSSTEISVSRFLISNLAFADLCMGLYLMLIASMDYHSVGTYFNFAFNWQYGIGCQVAGFLTVFAGHLSIFTLTVVTLERWFAITYAMHLTKRIRLSTAAKIMLCGWMYSILMASLPLFGVSNYSSTSICLPMEVHKLVDKAYLYSILILNGISFAIIVFCYAQIYFSLGYETRRANTRGEMTIAKKMALLVFIDFATYSPIAFFGFCALVGYPLIGVTQSKILLVFFYPLNACANPYLYALMTAQYRHDFYDVISRCGICKNKAERIRMSESIPMSKPPTIHTNSSIGNNGNGCNHVNNNSRSSDTFL